MIITTRQAQAVKVASKDSSRPILASVNISAKDGVSVATATDSYRLLSISTNTDDTVEATNVKATDVKTALKVSKAYGHNTIDLSESEVVDGVFPLWQQLKPNADKMRSQSFDRKLLLDVLQAIDARYVRISMNEVATGASSIEARSENHDYYALVMPIKNDALTENV